MKNSTSQFQFNLYSEFKKGLEYYELGKLEESWGVLSKICNIYPAHPDSLHLLGLISYHLGKNKIAGTLICRALKNNYNNPFYFNSLGLVFKEEGKIYDAITCYQKALQLKENYTNAYINMGLCFNDLERYDQAICCFERALNLNDTDKKAYYSLGIAYKENNRLDDAIDCYKKFIKLAPDDLMGRLNLGILFLMKGDLIRGSRLLEARFGANNLKPKFTGKVWNGENIVSKTLLIYAEQGLGDTIQFIRYVELAKKRGANIIVAVQSDLIGLFSKLKDIDQLIPLESAPPNFDYCIPLLSLPRIFKTTLDTIPSSVPYLTPDNKFIDKWSNLINKMKGIKVGLVWAGNSRYKRDDMRSFRLDLLRPLFDIQGINFFSFQKQNPSKEIDSCCLRSHITDLSSFLLDFQDTAAAITLMDLIITVDTAVAHLAGALAKPVWLMLPFSPDWRWMLKREDSPWYPTMKLIRQKKRGDWGAVVDKISRDLRELARINNINSPKKTNLAKSKESFYLNDLGNIYIDQKEIEKAILCYIQAIKLNPALTEAYYNLGNAYHKQNKLDNAISCYKKSLILNPSLNCAYNSMGNVLTDQGKLDDAIFCFIRALSLNPDYADPYNNLGNLFKKQKKLDKALVCYQKALSKNPHLAEPYFNMGNIYYSKDKLDEAISCYIKSLAEKNNQSEACYNNLGKTYEEQGKINKAIYCYERAIEIKPEYAEAHFNHSIMLLLKGKFKEGFIEYEWRFKRAKWRKIYPRRYTIPRWDGSAFVGKNLLVHGEQGLGDTIQFIRYMPLVKSRGGIVIFETRKALLRLLRGFPGIDQLIEMSFNKKDSYTSDLYIPLLTLPKILKTTIETIPNKIPYLYACSKKIKYWGDKIKSQNFKVGLVWRGSPTNIEGQNRSCPLENFMPLKNVPNVKFLGLQKENVTSQEKEIQDEIRITNLGELFLDFSDTAGVIYNLDLIITVDTSVAHLAGAMGKLTWILLPFAPDWRWLLGVEKTPWYPTIRLFRQSRRGDWKTLLSHVARELNILVNGGGGGIQVVHSLNFLH